LSLANQFPAGKDFSDFAPWRKLPVPFPDKRQLNLRKQLANILKEKRLIKSAAF
jgi:hypothetical protein